MAITNAASVPGRILPAFASDYIGQFNTMFLVALSSRLSILCFWLPLEIYPSHAGLLVFAAVYGFVSGGFVSLMTPCVVALAGGRTEELGVKLGGFMAVVALA